MTKEENVHECCNDVWERNRSAAISVANSSNSKVRSHSSELYYKGHQSISSVRDETSNNTNVIDHRHNVGDEHETLYVNAESWVECVRDRKSECNHSNSDRNGNNGSNNSETLDNVKKRNSDSMPLLECVANVSCSAVDKMESNSHGKYKVENNSVEEEAHQSLRYTERLEKSHDEISESATIQNRIIAGITFNGDKSVTHTIPNLNTEIDQKQHSNASCIHANCNHEDHQNNDNNDNDDDDHVEMHNRACNDKHEDMMCDAHVERENDEEIHLENANAHRGVFTREHGATRMNSTINKASKAVYFWGSLVATAVPGYLGKKTGLTSQFLHWNYIIPHLLLGAIPIVTQVGASGDHLDQLRRQLESRQETLGLVVACLEDDELNGFGMNFIQFAKEVDWRREVNRHVEYLKVAMEDTKAAVKLESVVDAVEKLHTCIDVNKQTAYVHCKAGKGRSWMVVMCYLTTYGGLPFDCAARLVQDRRVQINPSLAQQCFAREFAVRVAQNNLLKHSYLTSHLLPFHYEHEERQDE